MAATTVLVIAPGAAFADSASDLVAKTNSSRAGNGLSGYSVASDLTSIAQRHAANMASSRSIYHNGSLGSEACCWRSIGENVGVGSSASAVHNAFMNSSPHRANILSSAFTEVGIGTARGSDGQLYVDEVFRQRMGGSTHAAPVIHHSAPTTHVTHSVSSAPRRYPTVAKVAKARPTRAAILRYRVHNATADRKKLRDPVAAALTFPNLMERLTRR